MSHLVNEILIGLVLIACVLGLAYAKAARRWFVFLLLSCFIFRVAVSIALAGGLKYVFVVDSLMYEYKGWLLAQSWMSADLFTSLAQAATGTFNLYEIFVAWVFTVFGHDTLVPTLFNCVFSTATIALLAYIYLTIFADQVTTDQKKYSRQSALCLGIALTVYPSFLVWSTTTTRDPLYFLGCVLFFAGFLTAFSKRSKAAFPWRVLALLIAAVGFYLVAEIRYYVRWLFIVAVLSGLVVHGMARVMTWKKLTVLLILIIGGSLFAYQTLFPGSTFKFLTTLQQQREAFANLRLLDSVAKSSFALDVTFDSIWSVVRFLPNALAHYFFGPFPWEIASLVQLFSLLEVSGVYLLARITYRGVLRFYRRAPFETVTLLVFVFAFSVSQALVISNMGTLFRHRTLSFLILLIFTSEGLNDVAKKNFPSLFPA